MSANLLAEFESFYQPSGVQTPAFTQADSKQSHGEHVDVEEDDDDFGDFETAQSVPPGTSSYSNVISNEALPTRQNRESPASKRGPKPRDENVLFDAEEDVDEEDDFGDFEGSLTPAPAAVVKQPQQSQAQPKATSQASLIDFDDFISAVSPPTVQTKISPEPGADFKSRPLQSELRSNSQRRTQHVVQPPQETAANDLLALDAPQPKTKQSHQPKAHQSFLQQSQSRSEPKPQAEPQAKPQSKPQAKPHPKPQMRSQPPSQPTSTAKIDALPSPAEPEDDDWDDFETAEPTELKQGAAVQPLHLDQLLLNNVPHSCEPPPTNIPPPAILLSLFPSLAGAAQEQLFNPISQLGNTNGNERDQVLQLPETQQYLRGLIDASIVLARIVAGRKNRWKRDNILSQSMRIGPASSSGKSGGMKLAGVDRAENAREEREVADAVGAWTAQLGRLKSAVNSAGKLGDIPEISESYTVRLAPASEGAIGSAKPCVLCGLKRNERIARVDVSVEDSFGEWWTEHWGHNDCARFWYAQKDALRSR